MGKRAPTLFNCISVTDGIINEQNKSIGIGPLNIHVHVQTEFEAISLLLYTQKVMSREPGGVSNVAILARSKCKTPKCILP